MNIDAKTAQTIKIGTTENNSNQDFLPLIVQVFVKNVTGTVIIPVAVSIGTVAGNYIDVLPINILTGLTTVNGLEARALTGSRVIPSNTDIFLKITTAVTGVSAMNLTAVLLGHYI